MGSTPLPSHTKNCKNGINSFPDGLSNRNNVEEERENEFTESWPKNVMSLKSLNK